MTASQTRSSASSGAKYALSIVIPCASPRDPHLLELLASIERQSFPKERLEVLVMSQGNSEEARTAGILKARGTIIGCLDADNQLLGYETLQRLYDAASRWDVSGAYPSHYAWFSDDPPLNRYFALLGANDPLAWWLGKADRRSWLVAPGTGTVVFGRSIPTLGSNGFFVKRWIIQQFAAQGVGHIDTCELMRQAGHATYAVVDTVIWHKTGTTLWSWLRKRYHYARTLYFQQLPRRQWLMVASPRDWLLVGLFGVASLLLLPHLWLSVRGYRRVRDWSWLLHPVACLGLTCVYSLAWAQHVMGRTVMAVAKTCKWSRGR